MTDFDFTRRSFYVDGIEVWPVVKHTPTQREPNLLEVVGWCHRADKQSPNEARVSRLFGR